MFRVLIADDEPSVIESLRESIDWTTLGLEVAACASNGKAALEAVRQKDIDIAILDIRMPGMNGLEACASLRREFDDLQIIIISGFAEFAYAEKAIEYGVIGYCLKPLEYEKVRRCLVKAISRLEKSATQAAGADLLDAIDNDDMEKTAEILRAMGFSGSDCCLTVTVGEGQLTLPKDGLKLETGRNLCCYLTGSPFPADELTAYLQTERNAGVGLMEDRVSVRSLRRALKQCTVQAYQFFFTERPSLCRTFDERKANELIQAVADSISKEKWDLALMQLKDIEHKHKNAFTIRTAQKLCNTVHMGSLFHSTQTDYYIYDFRHLTTAYANFSAMMRSLRQDIRSAQSDTGAGEYTNTAFMRLLSYIGENYRSDISLASAGKALNMSPNYVSQLFKKESGETFVHYITQLRMDDAVRLLTTTNMPVVDIAMQVGFNDYFYFLKTFKRVKKKTPSQYRQSEI